MIEYYTTDFLYFCKTKKSCMEIKIIRKSGCYNMFIMFYCLMYAFY